MPVKITKDDFLKDPQGKTFADVVNDSEQPFGEILAFFSDADRQRRMVESEIHHDRAPLAGVVRELESLKAVDQFLSGVHAKRTMRLRQAIGVVVRMIMEKKGWQKTGRKGSLGVRAPSQRNMPAHNTGGLAFWFVRAERYENPAGVQFEAVRNRSQPVSQPSRKRVSKLD